MKAIFIGLKGALLNYIDFNVGIAVKVDVNKTKNKKLRHTLCTFTGGRL